MAKTEDKIKHYEEVLALHPDTSAEEQKALFAESGKMIESFKGSIYCVDSWGSRPFANTGEKKIARGWYFHRLFSAPPEAIIELKRKLRINSRVVYFHHERLGKGETPKSRKEKFLKVLELSAKKEREREEKIRKKQGLRHDKAHP